MMKEHLSPILCKFLTFANMLKLERKSSNRRRESVHFQLNAASFLIKKRLVESQTILTKIEFEHISVIMFMISYMFTCYTYKK